MFKTTINFFPLNIIIVPSHLHSFYFIVSIPAPLLSASLAGNTMS